MVPLAAIIQILSFSRSCRLRSLLHCALPSRTDVMILRAISLMRLQKGQIVRLAERTSTHSGDGVGVRIVCKTNPRLAPLHMNKTRLGHAGRARTCVPVGRSCASSSARSGVTSGNTSLVCIRRNSRHQAVQFVWSTPEHAFAVWIDLYPHSGTKDHWLDGSSEAPGLGPQWRSADNELSQGYWCGMGSSS